MNGPIGWLKGKVARLLVRVTGKLLARELYRAILGREADAAGLAHSVGMIRETGGIEAVVESFITSTEFRARTFDRIAPDLVVGAYQGLFKREPEPLGLEQGITVFRSNHDLAVLLAFMIRSNEFKLRALYMCAPRLVEACYEGVLGRPSDAKGYSNVLALFRSNLDLATVLRFMIQSAEFRSKYTAAMELKDRGLSAGAAIVRPSKGRLIIVSTNCTTGGTAAALRECLPGDTLLPVPLPSGINPAKTAAFVEKVKHADVWVTANPKYYWELIQKEQTARTIQMVRIPFVNFPAFHPDLSYVWKNPQGAVTALRYSSAICAWAYNAKLEIKDAKKLFNRRTYAGLGYLDLWNPSIAALREMFAKCDFDFGRFILGVKRRGVFMYSLDHPKASLLIELAKLTSLKLGAPESVLEKVIDISDGLTDDIWPLYPEIAEEYALPGGSYDWKIWGKWHQGIDNFIEFAYGEYANERIPAGALILANRDQALYDRVLGPQVGVL